jgi:hypothetical protein
MSFFSRRDSESQGAAHPALEIPTYRQVLPRLTIEVERARRFEHPLAIVVVRPQAGSTGLAYTVPSALRPWSIASFTASSPELFVRLGSFLRAHIRTIDVLATAPDAQSYLLGLVETARPGAELLVTRFRDGFRELARAPLHVGIAEFPRDGMMLEDLLEHAGRERHDRPADDTPVIRPRTSHG